MRLNILRASDFVFGVLFFCVLMLFVAPSAVVADGGWEVISDASFRNGFALLPPDFKTIREKGGVEKAIADTLVFSSSSAAPSWRIAQWHSRYSLARSIAEKKKSFLKTGKNYAREYANETKRIERSRQGTLLLEINTAPEYEHPRRQGEQWPHLLVEQDFARRPNMGRVESLAFTMALKLVSCVRSMLDSEYDPALHTAQSPLFFILKNTNRQSADYNKFIWLGIPSYDYRYRNMFTHEIVSWDVASNTYIYNIPQIDVWGDIHFDDGKWHRLSVDLLPYVRECLSYMKKKGFFTATSLSDLEITGMNFGWEAPGAFYAAIALKGLSLYAREK